MKRNLGLHEESYRIYEKTDKGQCKIKEIIAYGIYRSCYL